MAKPKKGALVQWLVPMVDATDFATIESAITESDFNSGATKLYAGANHGGSAAATTGTVSKTASLVRSGVFRITLKGTENNYDTMILRISKTGCAEQIISWENTDYDESDLYSFLSDSASDIKSAVLLTQSLASDAHSAATQINSRVLLTQSLASDAHSAATAGYNQVVIVQSMASDAASAAQQGNSRVILVQSRLSDLDSRLVSDLSDVLSQLTVVQSMASDAASAAAQGNSRVLLTQSLASDAHSAAVANALNASDLSDIRSAIAAGPAATVTASDISDIASAVWANATRTLTSAAAATITASDISDIASAVRVTLASDLSDILSAAVQTNSRVLVVESMASDAASAAAQGNSRVLLVQSRLSDFDSRTVSDISDVLSQLTVVQSMASDAASAAAQANSRVLLTQSLASDAHSAAVATGTGSDIASKVWAVTRTEPTTVVSPTGTVKSALEWLVAVSRNKITQTSAVQSIRNDADAADIASAAVSDDGTTFTRGEFA